MFREFLDLNARKERGNVLITTLLVLFAVSVIGMALTTMSSTDLKIAGNNRSKAEALFVAEAGVSEAIHRVSLANPTIGSVGGWSGNVSIADALPYDPNWIARIYLTSPATAPGGGGSVIHTGTLQDPSKYLEYSRPSGTDEVITVQHKWVDRNSDGIKDLNEIVRFDDALVPQENFGSGFPVDVISVIGRSGASQRGIEVEVTRRSISPRTLGAIYIDGKIGIKGEYGFCGYNHDVNMPSGLVPNACFAWHVGGGDLPAIACTGYGVKFEDGEIAGSPVPIDNSPTNPFYSLADLLGLPQSQLDDMLLNADHTTIQDPMHGITYINGDAVINSSVTGSGLLYVKGHLDVNPGPLNYRGLIYAEGKINVKSGSWILGSIVGAEADKWQSKIVMSGILYSLDAMRLTLSQTMPMEILSWREN